jgi:hypothetical protein
MRSAFSSPFDQKLERQERFVEGGVSIALNQSGGLVERDENWDTPQKVPSQNQRLGLLFLQHRPKT